jgi:hypothetical protein
MNWREMSPAQRRAAGIATTPAELRGDYSGGHSSNNEAMRAAIAKDQAAAAAKDSDAERTATEALRLCLQALATPAPNLELQREFDRYTTIYKPTRGADAKVNAEYAAQHRGGSSRPPASRPKPQGRPLPAIRYGADSVVRRCNRIEAMYRERYDNKKVSYSNE